MKKTIKLMGVLLGKTLFTSSNIDKFTGKDDKLFILQQFENIIWEYSNSNEKDFLRISVIKSLKFSLPQIFELLKANNYGLLLSYSKTFIRLLQDEIPEIRQKMGNFLSKLLGTYLNKSSTEEYTFNFNFVLEKYISFLIELFVNNSGIYSLKENLEKLIEFLVIMIFESEFFIFKKRNYFDKRIFSFDKTNKFHDDVCLKNFAFSHIKTINQFLQKNSNIQNGEMNVGKFMESYAKEKKFSFLV